MPKKQADGDAAETKVSEQVPGKAAEKTKTREQAGEKTKTRSKRFQRKVAEPADVAKTYFEAFERGDLDAFIGHWAPGGVENITPLGTFHAPDQLRAFFTDLLAAFPDTRFEVLEQVTEGDKVVVRWRNTGTFCGAPFQGIEPNGRRIDIEGVDMLTIEDGLIQRNDVYYDGSQFARQLGLLPEQGSAAERGVAAAFNFRTRASRALFKLRREPVADGVWLIRGGFPSKTMNAYLIEGDGGVTLFDAGSRSMTAGIASEAAALGGIRRIVLSHSHGDHRGSAPGLGAPVFCHAAEVADAEGDGGEHYFDFSRLERWFARALMPRMLRRWDGGPVKVEGTVAEGEEIEGFKVLHFPGHAPGLIGLWRESDRLALVGDVLYTLDPQTGRPGPPRVPHPAFNESTEQARASILKLAALEPAAAWPGHANAVTGDVRSQLERIAREG